MTEAKTKTKKTATKKSAVAVQEWHYSVIKSPVVTEKSTMASEFNKVVFKVCSNASKSDVKQAVEALFGVTVTKVNTINLKGKTKRFRGLPGQRSDIRKAVVTLAAGQSIDVAAGVK